MVGIEGHLMNPAKVNYIGPVIAETHLVYNYAVRLIVDGHEVWTRFTSEEIALKARRLMSRMPGLP